MLVICTRFKVFGATILVLAVSCLAFANPCFGRGNASSPSQFLVGRRAPDFILKDLDGREVQLSSYRGHTVLLDFWATWCGACRVEIPTIERIAKQFAKNDLVVLGINAQEPDSVVRKFVAKNNITYPVVLTKDNAAVLEKYDVSAFPTLAIVDKTGIVAAYFVGENLNTEQVLHENVKHVLSAKYTAPVPKVSDAAQTNPQNPKPPDNYGGEVDPNWKPKTADEFLARAYAMAMSRRFADAHSDIGEALKLRPKWAAAVFARGYATYLQGDLAAALLDFNQVIREKPEWAVSYKYRGYCYAFQGNYERSLEDFREFIKLEPYSTVGLDAIGRAYRELAQYNKAKASLDKALEIKADDLTARENRAVVFVKQNKLDGALAELEIVLGLVPGDTWAKSYRNAIRENQRDLLNALEDTMQGPVGPFVQPTLVSKIEPQYSEEARRAGVNASILCGFIVDKDGHLQNVHVVRGAGFGLDEKAIEALHAWVFRPAAGGTGPVGRAVNAEMKFHYGRPGHEHQFARLDFDQSSEEKRPELIRGELPINPKRLDEAQLSIALTVEPSGKVGTLSVIESEPREWGQNAMREMKNWRFRPALVNGKPMVAKGTLQLVLTATGAPRFAEPSTGTTRGPDPKWQPKTAEEFLARGDEWLWVGKRPEAKADIDEALRLRPDLMAAVFKRGYMEASAGNHRLAIADFDRVIQNKSDWPDVYQSRSDAYRNSGEAQKALADIQKALELNPNSETLLKSLERLYVDQERWDLAKEILDHALELNPQSSWARRERSLLHKKQGDATAERKELTTILALNPRDKWAQEALAKNTGKADAGNGR